MQAIWPGFKGKMRDFFINFSSQSHLEINCSCKPHLNFTIIGVEIISEARTFECYSSRDGYLKSCKGRELKGEERASSAGEATLYAACVKFDDPVLDVQIKVNKHSATTHRLALINLYL